MCSDVRGGNCSNDPNRPVKIDNSTSHDLYASAKLINSCQPEQLACIGNLLYVH